MTFEDCMDELKASNDHAAAWLSSICDDHDDYSDIDDRLVTACQIISRLDTQILAYIAVIDQVDATIGDVIGDRDDCNEQ